MIRLLFVTWFVLPLCLNLIPSPAHAGILKVGVLSNFLPQYLLDDNGEPDGLAVDLFEQVIAETDYQPEYRIYEGWDALQQGLRDGEVDLIPNMGMVDSRREWASFSVPLETFRVFLFVRKGNSSLRFPGDFERRKLGVVRLNIGEKIADKHPGLQTQTYADILDAEYIKGKAPYYIARFFGQITRNSPAKRLGVRIFCLHSQSLSKGGSKLYSESKPRIQQS